jgi:hypothetical protein
VVSRAQGLAGPAAAITEAIPAAAGIYGTEPTSHLDGLAARLDGLRTGGIGTWDEDGETLLMAMLEPPPKISLEQAAVRPQPIVSWRRLEMVERASAATRQAERLPRPATRRSAPEIARMFYTGQVPRRDQRAANADYYRRNRTFETRRVRIRQAATRDYLRELRSVPCQDCGGVFEPHQLDFDHRDPSAKSFRLTSGSAMLASPARLRAEVAKCDVVCANCHRVRT